MPTKLPFSIIGGAYEARDRNNIQELINMYVEIDQTGGDAQVYLRGTHGLTEWFDSEEVGEVRGFDVFAGSLYVVIGDTLYSVSGSSGSGGVKTSKGTIETSAGQCQIFNDGTKIAVCDGTYVYGLTQALTDQGEIAITAFLGLDSALDGDYYTFTDSDQGETLVADFLALTSGSYGDYYTFTDTDTESGITIGEIGVLNKDITTIITSSDYDLYDDLEAFTETLQGIEVDQIGVLNKDISTTITSSDYEIVDDITETSLLKGIEAGNMAYQDGWFIVSVPDTGSALASTDLNSWSSISAEGNPDFIVSLISDHRELILFGADTIEIDYNTGSAVLPFARTSGGLIETGCGAKYSPAKINNLIYFLDNNNQVRVLSALQTKIVSTPSIAYQISTLEDPQEAIGYSYSVGGHVVYVLTFPGANLTYCFDTTTSIWYKWSTGGYNSRHTSNCFIRYNGLNLVGDKSNGKIYTIDPSSRLDGDIPIYRERTTQYTHNDSRTTFFERLLLEIQTATELTGDPQIMLDYSDDFGKTWEMPIQESLGEVGEYNHVVEFFALGSAKHRAFRIRITDDFFVSIQRGHLFGGVSWE